MAAGKPHLYSWKELTRSFRLASKLVVRGRCLSPGKKLWFFMSLLSHQLTKPMHMSPPLHPPPNWAGIGLAPPSDGRAEHQVVGATKMPPPWHRGPSETKCLFLESPSHWEARKCLFCSRNCPPTPPQLHNLRVELCFKNHLTRPPASSLSH